MSVLHLLGGIGLGIAPVVGERAVEEAAVAVDLVAAVLGGPLEAALTACVPAAEAAV